MNTTSHTNNNHSAIPIREDYPEFKSIMIKHFCQRADSVREQLDAWLAQDATLAPLVDKVRRNLHKVVAWYGTTTNPTSGGVAAAAGGATAASDTVEDLIMID